MSTKISSRARLYEDPSDSSSGDEFDHPKARQLAHSVSKTRSKLLRVAEDAVYKKRLEKEESKRDYRCRMINKRTMKRSCMEIKYKDPKGLNTVGYCKDHFYYWRTQQNKKARQNGSDRPSCSSVEYNGQNLPQLPFYPSIPPSNPPPSNPPPSNPPPVNPAPISRGSLAAIHQIAENMKTARAQNTDWSELLASSEPAETPSADDQDEALLRRGRELNLRTREDELRSPEQEEHRRRFAEEEERKRQEEEARLARELQMQNERRKAAYEAAQRRLDEENRRANAVLELAMARARLNSPPPPPVPASQDAAAPLSASSQNSDHPISDQTDVDMSEVEEEEPEMVDLSYPPRNQESDSSIDSEDLEEAILGKKK
jgi:hypothetical protein